MRGYYWPPDGDDHRLVFSWDWLGLSGAIVAILISLQVILPSIRQWIAHYLTPSERQTVFAFMVFIAALAALGKYLGVYDRILGWLESFKYDEFGSWASGWAWDRL
jgi:hypothetical protein